MSQPQILYLVIPCYNEQEVLPETHRRLHDKLDQMVSRGLVSPESRILFVNDGSKDKTWELICEYHEQDAYVCGLNLAHNRGHQNALLAGLMTAKDCADMVVSMDADLQDDVEAVDQFVDAYYKGSDIVYGVRSSRESDTMFKRSTALGFYRVMKMLGVEIVANHAEYRLMSKRALEGLSQFGEVNLFLRGIVPLVGYPSATVPYVRSERFAGETKYPFKKMLGFAMDGVTSFSTKPIRLISVVGLVIFIVSILVLLYTLIQWLLGGTVAGWPTIVGSIWMIGGIQLLCLGIIGEYIGKIYSEVKHRPRYIIESFLKK